MQIVFKGSDFAEAHIVAGMLESIGIKAYVGGHHLQGALGAFGLNNTIHVRVDSKDVEQASAIVKEYDSQQKTSQDQSASPTKHKHLYISLFLVTVIIFSTLLIVNL